MYYGGSHFLQRVYIGSPAVSVHAIVSCSQDDVSSVTTIARHTTVCTQLLKRNPLTIIGKQHRECGSATLHGLHLHDNRYVLDCLGSHLLPSPINSKPYKHLIYRFVLRYYLYVAERHRTKPYVAALCPRPFQLCWVCLVCIYNNPHFVSRL